MDNRKKLSNTEIKQCKFIVFSDIHYLDKRTELLDFNLSKKLTQFSIPIIDELISKINKSKLDMCICLGDLIEDTYTHDKDIANYIYIWNRLRKIKIPFYSVIGNHDLRTMNSRDELEKIMGINNATFSFDLNHYHFIILSTNIREDLGSDDGGIYKAQCMSEDDINWLKDDLKKNKLPCVIFTHFGIAEDELMGNYWFEKCPEEGLMSNRKVIKSIIKNDDNILAIFSGHQHWTKQLYEDGKKYFVVGSLTDNVNMTGRPDGVYLEVELQGENIEIVEKHINIKVE